VKNVKAIHPFMSPLPVVFLGIYLASFFDSQGSSVKEHGFPNPERERR
jgi:hypothetical protein